MITSIKHTQFQHSNQHVIWRQENNTNIHQTVTTLELTLTINLDYPLYTCTHHTLTPPRPQSITLIDTHSPHLLDSKSNDNFDKTKNKPLLINTTHLSMMHNIIPSVTTHEHWTHENRNHQTRYTRNKQTHATTQSTGKEESRTDRNQTQLCHYTVITTCTQLQSG